MSRTNESATCSDDEPIPQTRAAKSGHRGFVLQRGDELRLRRLQRGDEAEENAGRDGEHEGESEHAPIGAEIEEEVDLDRQSEIAHGAVDECGQPGAAESAGERDEKAFGEQLPNESCTAGADREPDGDFLPPLGRAGEEQIREIDAGEEKDERANGSQDPGKAEDGVADFRQEKAGLREDESAPGVLGIILRELRGERLELGLRLRGADAGFQAADDEVVVAGAAARASCCRARFVSPSSWARTSRPDRRPRCR